MAIEVFFTPDDAVNVITFTCKKCGLRYVYRRSGQPWRNVPIDMECERCGVDARYVVPMDCDYDAQLLALRGPQKGGVGG